MTIRAASTEAFERHTIEAGKPLIEKWQHFLDAPTAPKVSGAYERYALSRLLETTEKVLAKEAVQTTTVFGSNYVKAMLGMTRQIWPRLFGTRLVSVQPLDRPTGQLFHLAVTRDDGSTLGVDQRASAASQGYNDYIASRTYADHTNGEAGEIEKSMKLAITSSNVEITKVKKLKTEASWELMTDLSAYHDLSAMDLLQGAAVDEISQEIDATILKAVRDAAIAHKTVTYGGNSPGSETWTNGEWRKRIQNAILRADAAIYRASLRRPNVMVVGMDAYLHLLDLNGFVMSPDASMEGGSWGIQPVGTLNQQYEVLLSRFVPDKEILLGRRGSGFLDAGIVYSPYVALFITDRFFDVETQKTIQSFASRFDVFTLANHLYARVLIDDNATGISG